MSNDFPRSLWSALVAVVLTAGVPAFAGGAGQLVGTITDESGMAIPEARLTVTSPGASAVQTVVTDSGGRFRILVLETVLPVTVRAEADEKVPVVYSELRVRPDRVTRLDLRLRGRGAHHVVILIDGRVPYHHLALEGARSTLPGDVEVIDLRKCDSPGRDFLRAIEERPSAVLAIGEEAARLARSYARDIPVVHTMVPDPVPGELSSESLCGVSLSGGFEQQLSRLRELDSGLKTIATIYDPSRLTGAVGRLREAAAQAGMELKVGHVHAPGDLSHAFEALAGEPIDAFLVLMDPEVYTASNFAAIRQFAEDRGLIFVVPDASLARAEKSFSFRPGFWESGAAAGRLVRQIVAGRLTPAEVGILSPVDGAMGGDSPPSPSMRWRPDPGEALPLVGAMTLAAALNPHIPSELEPEE
jgi:hypothetical protein